MSRTDSTAENEAEKKHQVSLTKALISSIKAASSREEIALLIGACRSLIEQCPASFKDTLQSQLTTVANTAESKIQNEVIRKQEAAQDAEAQAAPIAPDPVKLADKSPEDLEKLAKPMSEKKLNILSAAVLAAQETGKTNLKDTAFGNALAAIEEQEKKEEHRASSKSRVDLLRGLGETLSSGGEIPEAMFEQAKDLKIDLKLDEDGKPSKKTLNAIEAIQKLKPEAIETERAKRAAPTEDIFDKTKEGESIGLDSLFGDQSDFEDNTPAPTSKKATSKPAFDKEAALAAGAEERAKRAAKNAENEEAVKEVGSLAKFDPFVEKSTPTLLNKIVKNSTRPARIDSEVSTDLTNLSPILEAASRSGEKVKRFENEDAKVILTQRKNANDGRFRDIEVNVEKGPALVAICMQHENGAKDKGSKFAIEFDKDGNAVKTVPDLSLVETDKDKNLAFIEVDGKRMVLPMSAERVEKLKREVEKFGPEPERAAKGRGSDTPALATEKVASADPRLAEISKKQPHEKTPDEIKLEYASMSKDHMKLLVEGRMEGNTHEADVFAVKLANYELLHSADKKLDGSLIPQEQIDQNLKSMEEARKIGQIQYQAEVKEELTKAFKSQAEAVASYDGASLGQAEGQEKVAKEKLAHAGLTPNSIKSAEKEALSSAVSKSMESGLQKEMDQKDPLIEAKEQKFLKTKMSSSGMTREEVKEKELDSTLQAANSLSSKLRQQREGASPEDQKKIDEQIGKIEKITSPRVASLSAPTKAEKIVSEVQTHYGKGASSSHAVPQKKTERAQSQSAGKGMAI